MSFLLAWKRRRVCAIRADYADLVGAITASAADFHEHVGIIRTSA
jgi:hypothetical protein